MGRKTVRWSQIKDPKYSGMSCSKCSCTGIIEEYDYIYDSTTRFYCDCYYGKQEQEKDKERNERSTRY